MQWPYWSEWSVCASVPGLWPLYHALFSFSFFLSSKLSVLRSLSLSLIGGVEVRVEVGPEPERGGRCTHGFGPWRMALSLIQSGGVGG
jgi:hypothetical protein